MIDMDDDNITKCIQQCGIIVRRKGIYTRKMFS